eukprot:4511493-Amphidinium_carterae.1
MIVPAAKRQRVDVKDEGVMEEAQQQQGMSNVLLSNMPCDFTHDTLIELHVDMGLEVEQLISSTVGGKRPGSLTCSCILKYASKVGTKKLCPNDHPQSSQSVSQQTETSKVRGLSQYLHAYVLWNYWVAVGW